MPVAALPSNPSPTPAQRRPAATHVYVDVFAAEHHAVVVDEPDVLVNNVTEVAQAAARLIDEETDRLRKQATGAAAAATVVPAAAATAPAAACDGCRLGPRCQLPLLSRAGAASGCSRKPIRWTKSPGHLTDS